MSKTKKILVKDVLNLMMDEQEVICHLYAYGCFYGSTQNDGMKTVADCKEQMNNHCINALVTRIRTEDEFLIVQAEIVY